MATFTRDPFPVFSGRRSSSRLSLLMGVCGFPETPKMAQLKLSSDMGQSQLSDSDIEIINMCQFEQIHIV